MYYRPWPRSRCHGPLVETGLAKQSYKRNKSICNTYSNKYRNTTVVVVGSEQIDRYRKPNKINQETLQTNDKKKEKKLVPYGAHAEHKQHSNTV